MDPDATLRDIRDLIDEINATTDKARLVDLSGQLTEKVEALDTWITSGGFLPASWARSLTR